MNGSVQVQYVGFEAKAVAREYTLRVRQAAEEWRDFTVTIPHEAFLSRRARYQDAPEICFLKLLRELAAHANHPPSSRLSVTDAELEDYRQAHAPKPPQRRSKPPVAPVGS